MVTSARMNLPSQSWEGGTLWYEEKVLGGGSAGADVRGTQVARLVSPDQFYGGAGWFGY